MRRSVASKRPDIPGWFMTYTDVVTLLMTFFILLLTFATHDPERFEKIRVAIFGEGASTGLAGPRPDGIERDSMVTRVRPRSARLTMRGSEVPPIDFYAEMPQLEANLAALEADEYRDLAETWQITMPIAPLFDAQSDLSPVAQMNARLLASLLLSANNSMVLEVSDEAYLARLHRLAELLIFGYGILPGRIAFSLVSEDVIEPTHLRIVLNHHLPD